MMGNSFFLKSLQSLQIFAVLCGAFASAGLLILTVKHVDLLDHTSHLLHVQDPGRDTSGATDVAGLIFDRLDNNSISRGLSSCATVEEMGNVSCGWSRTESLRVRKKILRHFELYGSRAVRALPPELFCKHGFVLGKSFEAGFGNEMYKILTAAALSIMLNRSLIIGQTRGKFPFGDFISYSNASFTLEEVKHLWRHNGCLKKYGRHLTIRTDDFLNPTKTNVLCSNWRDWEQPIIWFQGTTDAVAAQFFLKNVHSDMRNAAYGLFGGTDSPSRPNVFGELMRILVLPTQIVEDAVDWALGNGTNPDISLHMRMLMSRSSRAIGTAIGCVRKMVESNAQGIRPKVVLISDTPSIMKSMTQYIQEFAEVLSFDYQHFNGTSRFNGTTSYKTVGFRVQDWGPAPRWVAFVDFFLAARAKHAVISGAQKRVGTTYVQLVAALAAAQSLEESSLGWEGGGEFKFLSSFQSNILVEGLSSQAGWGHVWSRYAGTLSCHNQVPQCAHTSLLPSAWWDSFWQSPTPRHILRLQTYGVLLFPSGLVDERTLSSHCEGRPSTVGKLTFLV